jgi:DNA-binding XRE family transcriptional regulator
MAHQSLPHKAQKSSSWGMAQARHTAPGQVRLTQAELARRAGIRPQKLSRIEKGKSTPDTATIPMIEGALEHAHGEESQAHGVSARAGVNRGGLRLGLLKMTYFTPPGVVRGGEELVTHGCI